MSRNKSWLTAAAVASAIFAISAPAHAQATRTWVSGTGNDADPCSRTAPCKTFAGAISKTATNGIINCIDNGGYGAVTITRSMTIDCHETLASVLTNEQSPTGIIINVTGAADPKDTLRTVRLRNIDIAGVNAASTGISILAGAAVILEDMSITGFTKTGISDTRTEGKTSLVVKNSIVANNAGAGISAQAQDNSVRLDNVHSLKNAYGAAFGKTNNGAITRSVFSNNTIAGVETDSGASVMMESSVVSYNTTGIASSGSPFAFANSDVVFNGAGVFGATSFGNNRIFGNGAPGAAPTPAGAPSTDLGQQ